MSQITLRAARINAGYTQKEAADMLGISKTTLVKWEQGRTFPDAIAVSKICALYRTHYDDICFLPTNSL